MGMLVHRGRGALLAGMCGIAALVLSGCGTDANMVAEKGSSGHSAEAARNAAMPSADDQHSPSTGKPGGSPDAANATDPDRDMALPEGFPFRARIKAPSLEGGVAWLNTAAPIDLGPATDQVYLVLYGTGLRQRSALSNVICNIGGVTLTPAYVGAQGSLAGLDQVNLLLPRTLAGRGEVSVMLTVDGKQTNTVKVQIK